MIVRPIETPMSFTSSAPVNIDVGVTFSLSHNIPVKAAMINVQTINQFLYLLRNPYCSCHASDGFSMVSRCSSLLYYIGTRSGD